MQGLTLKLDRDDASYVPGQPITGTVAWDLSQGPDEITVRLIWQTSGKGTQDVGVAHELNWVAGSLREERDFSFPGIEGPYSFSGELITVGWLVEIVAEPGGEHAEQTLMMSPTGEEVRP